MGNNSKNIFYRGIEKMVLPVPNKSNCFIFVVAGMSVIVFCFVLSD